MKILGEFKEFALKGNVVDLAVGVIIGAAFGRVVTSLVEGVLMPPISFLLSGVDVKDWGINLGTVAKPVLIKYGVFCSRSSISRSLPSFCSWSSRP